MAMPLQLPGPVSRELLLHMLYEAAELEHNLMCTYLYAAFSLKHGTEEGLSQTEADAVANWRTEILAVAIDEMSHLVAVWNLTSALGGAPRFGRGNFPLDPGYLPARVVVRLAPFGEDVLQHFVFLERPADSVEPDGEGFEPERLFVRGTVGARLTPMGLDYATVGEFYSTLSAALEEFVAAVGEKAAFSGDRELQLAASDVDLPGSVPVVCLKTAKRTLAQIVEQGEGAVHHTDGSHFARFCRIRTEYHELSAKNPQFRAAHPAATNPVLRRPPRPEGRVWIEDANAIATVDLANACYGLMLRFMGYAYALPTGTAEKNFAVDTGIALMRAVALLAEQAARLPAGSSNAHCNAGVSFTALRDTGALTPGRGARLFFQERLNELAAGAVHLRRQTSNDSAQRVARSADLLSSLAARAKRALDLDAPVLRASATKPTLQGGDGPLAAEPSQMVDGREIVAGRELTLSFEARRCIHARFCVTGAPEVFLANVQGPWIHPDRMDTEQLVAIAHECPSGAITYQRKDGRKDEAPPPVNLLTIREGGPYALRAPLTVDGVESGFRATLCRCGASKNKPYCDGSHHEAGFTATGEPPTTRADSLAARDGALAVEPETNGPLRVRGNLEIVSGTGRVVARVNSARLCRCGASATKPFCDGTHAKNGFRS
jgi:CDGSH-type Zn-finger protein/uncharacterized Fe-S cluster protein YjdI